MSPAAVRWDLGPEVGAVAVQTSRSGIGARLAHDLVLGAGSWRGSLNFDAADLAASSVEVSVDVASLDVIGSSGGLVPLSSADRSEICRNLNDKVLKTARFPTITFRSVSVRELPGGYEVEGELTIMDVTRPCSLAVIVGDEVEVTGSILQTQFGIKPYSAMMGTLKIADRVTLHATIRPPAE